jgi:formamidopyrimidine-DNA glycosylase
MPELPEVETIVNGVKPYLINKKIIKCNVFTKKLRWNLQNDLAN